MISNISKSGETIDKNDIRLLFLSGHPRQNTNPPEYDDVYKHWLEVWGPHFKERNGIKKLHSDNFTKQDEICTFFLGSHCISTLCGRIVDLTRPTDLDDSYFDVWDEGSVAALKKNGPLVALMNQLTVIPKCPPFKESVRVRDVMLHLVLSHLLRCGVDSVAAVARKDKGMHVSLRLLGGESVKSDIPLHGGHVDLMVFFPYGRVTQDPKVIEVSNYIWNNNQVGQPLLSEKILEPTAA